MGIDGIFLWHSKVRNVLYGKSYQSLDAFEKAITDYIFYYNNKRIKTKRKGFSPMQYRTKSFQ
ncbi:hypothetical protein E8M05_10395 [Streptococcus pasteurianus]|nr:IS3 family transposase [Streptococcus pasteurianus]MCL4891040.1 integrase core domain-containing protein [Streptococcus gallolyticus]MCY7244005.1 integrase core domain-containing protein [Streptococcus pasteurianus]QCE37614.1 hypothetical protein E8M05_10395 [Streptococcus pasteurianus]RGB44634.1 hypothetical protein DW662_08655 [Streptococcus gallolyticus]RGB46126.1 hypothetical protein DW662_00190 [Streptococcus gallolyticus]